ncbi:Ribonuclease P protein subunit p30 [Apodemus speciosus]|uniref:Ribonuclease P protein subunit p30 n=1 Tax=Apodemus speciosus TaxID=105296 RepID=A0ABQ0FSY2_APOSI
MGYSVVAINHIVDFKEKKQEVSVCSPSCPGTHSLDQADLELRDPPEIEKPVAVSELFTTLPIVQGKSRPIKILTRLTIIVTDPAHCNVLRATSSRVRLYDIVAVFPKTEKLFHVACTHLDVDLVCITVTEKLPFYFKRPPINVAIERGLGFELVYGPAIRDATMRRYTISNALNLMQICKGKNVILSSAAERPLEIRGPYDVANLYPHNVLIKTCVPIDQRQLQEHRRKERQGTVQVKQLNEPSQVQVSVELGTEVVVCRCEQDCCSGCLKPKARPLCPQIAEPYFSMEAETRKTAFGIISTVKKPRSSEADDESLPACKKPKCEG